MPKANLIGTVLNDQSQYAFIRYQNVGAAAQNEKGDVVKMYKRVKNDTLAMPAYGHEEIGSIPQVKNTNGYINTAYPSLNDKQLGIGESTFGGREELQSDDGIIDC